MEVLEAEALKTYALKIDAATGEVVGERSERGEDPGEVIDRLARTYMVIHNVYYRTAYFSVTSDPANQDLVHAYAIS